MTDAVPLSVLSSVSSPWRIQAAAAAEAEDKTRPSPGRDDELGRGKQKKGRDHVLDTQAGLEQSKRDSSTLIECDNVPVRPRRADRRAASRPGCRWAGLVLFLSLCNSPRRGRHTAYLPYLGTYLRYLGQVLQAAPAQGGFVVAPRPGAAGVVSVPQWSFGCVNNALLTRWR